ncbi:MAG: N-acetyl-gamma-glutamyl-phosphate reductase [Sulfurovum sp.]|nr:N-acetyl-gamma-glutamyl-phosphate reductase [Sulfurovaceae bacterium]
MTNIGIIGASGYTGLELIKMLINHPKFKISYLATTTGDILIDALHPSLKNTIKLSVDKIDIKDIEKKCKLVFLALPHQTSMRYAKKLLKKNIKVIDLSADYRLELDNYEKYYCKHTDKKNLNNATYGLIEYYKEEIKNTNLIAGPGCYPTATLLAILPLMPYIDEKLNIFIDAKSGVSGAGKKLSENTHFVNMNDNIFAYNPLKHRHQPEIQEKIKSIHNVDTNINFVPHLIPATRGELVSIYATLKKDINPDINLLEILKVHYKDDKFIRIRDNPVDIKSTSGTHFCDIYASSNGDALFINSSIDNLLRGASSQALVCANLMCGYKEELGVPNIAYVP